MTFLRLHHRHHAHCKRMKIRKNAIQIGKYAVNFFECLSHLR